VAGRRTLFYQGDPGHGLSHRHDRSGSVLFSRNSWQPSVGYPILYHGSANQGNGVTEDEKKRSEQKEEQIREGGQRIPVIKA